MISIGNLAVGGRAKTPLAALVARRLREMGERPAILSRGYGRRDAADGVVVVRDLRGIRADLDRAGDEPLMLARMLEGVAVLVSADRYLAGRLAEHHLGCTVHVLDDGFQHFDLRRDVDILVIDREDIDKPRTLPSGRLREPVDAAASADALVVLGEAPAGAIPGGERPTWRARRGTDPARPADPRGAPLPAVGAPVLALAGIADPARFFADVRGAGWEVVREISFRDHYRYTRADAAVLFESAKRSGARAVLTTEKDAVRLLPFRPFPLPVAVVPLTLELEPGGTFERWLGTRVRTARDS